MNVAIERDKLAAHLVRFEEDLNRVMEAIIDSKFEVAEKLCASIRSRGESIGLARVVELSEEFNTVLQTREQWNAIHHFTNSYRSSMLQVIIPLGFGIYPV